MMIFSKEWRYLRKGRCPECGASLTKSVISECTGRHKDIQVRIQGLPCLVCSNGTHKKWYPSARFAEQFMSSLYESAQFPMSRSRTLTILKDKCFHCGQVLSLDSRITSSIKGTILASESVKCQLEVVGPVVTCTNCGNAQFYVSEESGSDLADAIIAAFNSSDFNPQFVYDSAKG